MASSWENTKSWRERNREAFNAQQRAYRAKRRGIRSAQAKARYAANPLKVLEGQRRWRARLAPGVQAARCRAWRFAQRTVLYPMPAVCDICKNPPNGRGKSGQTLHWDHDHKTEKHRGWLCNSCNVALGHFRDNPALLRAAAVYLEAH